MGEISNNSDLLAKADSVAGAKVAEVAAESAARTEEREIIEITAKATNKRITTLFLFDF